MTTRVRLENGEIAIDALENTRVNLTLKLAERDAKYQSYRLAAR